MCSPLEPFLLDMNGDGILTIRDVLAWLVWLFYYPGDLAVFLTTRMPNLARFLEVSFTSCRSTFSEVISSIFWGAISGSFLALCVLLRGVPSILWKDFRRDTNPDE